MRGLELVVVGQQQLRVVGLALDRRVCCLISMVLAPLGGRRL
jgi:hypothetical protein